MPTQRAATAIWIVGLVSLLTGCASPWQSPEAMARFQHKHYPDLALHYPVGMTRDEVLDITRGRPLATITLPVSDDTADAYAGTGIGVDLPIMTATARYVSGVEPASVEVLEFFGGMSGIGVEARYVFFDADGRVIAAFGSPWED